MAEQFIPLGNVNLRESTPERRLEVRKAIGRLLGGSVPGALGDTHSWMKVRGVLEPDCIIPSFEGQTPGVADKEGPARIKGSRLVENQLVVVRVNLKDVRLLFMAEKVHRRRRGLPQLTKDEGGASLVEEFASGEPRRALVLRQGAIDGGQPLAKDEDLSGIGGFFLLRNEGFRNCAMLKKKH